MAYAGETVRVISRVKDYDGVAITGTDGVAVTLELFDRAKVLIAGPVAMAWNGAKSYWFYDWATPGPAGATYRAKVTAAGATKQAWRVSRLRLTTSPV
jgi:acyl dehydratase